MANLLEAIQEIFGKLVDREPEPPINVGEVMDLWKYFIFIQEAIVLEQVSKNTTLDEELSKLLKQALDICHSHSERIKKVLKEQGIPIPASPGDKPDLRAESIPLGVRLNDAEIAKILAAKLLQSTKECSRSMMEAIRFDLGLMWANFFYEHAKLGAVLKSKMRNRGWIEYPPAYQGPQN
ncbi:DUF3231 family protein [Paenibacillus nanensis]|uniref:DUF3231 family protein n=1 Tax=Paenibacillus nanensis TaxID=393251 RepID=A0A3A1UYT0_9BACL|nr:DUF3231 family protein [Paenibacillus nanensis]RIX51523.1 DUF3231 family protein [Paenibacillus nanensis]